MNNVVQPLTENEPQRDAADWQLAFGVSAIAVRQFDDKKPIQMVIEKGDTFARFSAIRDKLFKESLRQACLKRASTGRIDAQAIALLAIRRRSVALEELDVDVVAPQSLGQAQAAPSRSDDAHPEALHDG
jgi:hypothetical protein